MQTRSPRGATAWVVSLNACPYLAVPAYWIFGGSDFDEYIDTRVSQREETRPIVKEMLEKLRQHEAANPQSPLEKALESLTTIPPTSGNDAELLVNGKAAMKSMIDSIRTAEDYILVEFYIVRDDETGGRFKDALLERAKAGVKIKFLYDDYGCLDLDNKFLKDLKEAGVEVNSFMNTKGDINRFNLNFRNHRKILVVDGKEAFVGGINIGDEYLSEDPEFSPWRDTHVRLRGPVALCVQIPFLEDWYWARREMIEGLNWDVDSLYAKSKGKMRMSCVPTGPSDDVETCSLFYQAVINSAEKRIWISTPYFVPDTSIIKALLLADARGVEVKILMPNKIDSKLVALSSVSFLEDFKASKVGLFQYQDGFLHQKAVLVDDDYCALGSANLDNRSLALNFEVMVGIQDIGFAAKVEEMLRKDFENAEKLDYSHLESKSKYEILKIRFSRLLAPIQ